MSDSNNYQPVACGFYDELGLRMMRGASSRLLVETDDGPDVIETHIEDLYTEGGAEYVRLENGRTIRLDRVLEVDDIRREGS
jgi:transcriptional antiterminator Rof (Rho-off)